MTVLNVRIQRLTDTEPAFPDLAKVEDVNIVDFGPICVQEGATKGGQIGVYFWLPHPDGTQIIASLTESNIRNLAGIVAGLRKRIDEGN